MLALVAARSSAAADPPRPNVVLVVADDLGYGDLGCYGATLIDTPRIDQMATEGTRLTGFHVAPSCSPTRAALMTGAYAARVGVRAPFGSWALEGLAPTEVTLAELLSAAGYRTGLFGKWHLGDSPDQLPTAQGFDEYFGSPWGLPGRPHTLMDGTTVVELDSDPVTWTPRFLARTLDFIDRAAGAQEPFLAILAHTSPHQPATASPAFVGRSADGREYGDSVEEIDASVGAILDRLDTLGLKEDTLVMFFSDNGAALGQDPYQAGSNGSLRGSKGSTFEGGVRAPCVVRWPGVTPPATVSGELVHVVDLFETLARAAGAPLAPGLPARDGTDVTRILAGQPGDPNRAIHHFRGGSLESVRQGRWKLRAEELYDLETDPSETTDLAATQGSIVASLAALRAAKAAEIAGATRPLSPTLRRSPGWRGDRGLSTTSPGSGDTWEEADGAALPWQVLDLEPAVDLMVVPTGAPPTSRLPGAALRVPAHAPRLQLRRPGGDLGVAGPGAPFTLEVWFRGLDEAPLLPAVLLDVGDETAGCSLTIGDAGQLGDDGSPGRRDDLLLCVGGSGSAAATSLHVDLPSGAGGWSEAFQHLVVTYDGGGTLRVHLNGFVVASAEDPNLDAGLDGTWALFGRDGAIGSSGLPSLPPFDATSFPGEIAGLRAFDRCLSIKEAELLLCRHVAYAYCAPLPSPTGERVRFDVVGDFRGSDRELEARVTGTAPGAFGVLLASQGQARLPAPGGYLCLDMTPPPLARPLLLVGGGSTGHLVRDLPFLRDLVGPWNFQVWTRLGGRAEFSNALRILFTP